MVDKHGNDGDELQRTGSEYPIGGKFFHHEQNPPEEIHV